MPKDEKTGTDATLGTRLLLLQMRYPESNVSRAYLKESHMPMYLLFAKYIHLYTSIEQTYSNAFILQMQAFMDTVHHCSAALAHI